ncbi:hypothetical protein [Riemerella columbipharyngis]|uniref:Uncharacterized protein n=1 Tax=Riemerella columbipharyngis TaxID=1071918 RepID=A0A1G7FJU4_9FLAO|nr:hypothetical protein [Riemerella columbipharyngis]SDE76110.1 hypothetical protein SAMN05421544_12329 [Riemerella columbipharyngis]
MEKRKDILVDDSNELEFINGDFAVGNSDIQHIDHIIIAQKGEYKQTPQMGLGVINYLKSNTDKSKFQRDVRIQLNYDGYENPNIDLSEGFERLKIEI